MEAVRQALWFIESHHAEPIGLDEIAGAAGLSRFHFSRTFAQATGVSVTGYLRDRRLTLAARALAEGAPDILSVALDAGYGSHEAFTRAFKDQFGVTPEGVRARGRLDHLTLLEPIVMTNQAKAVAPAPEPDFRDEGPFPMAGIREFRRFEDRAAIPGQWQRFGPHIGHVPGQKGHAA